MAPAVIEFIRKHAAEFEFPENGQGLVPLPPEPIPYSAPGVVLRSAVTQDLKKCVVHRGEDLVVADRGRLPKEILGVPAVVAAVVYTVEAFCKDPEVPAKMAHLVATDGYTHILLTILAFRGPRPAARARRSPRGASSATSPAATRR